MLSPQPWRKTIASSSSSSCSPMQVPTIFVIRRPCASVRPSNVSSFCSRLPSESESERAEFVRRMEGRQCTNMYLSTHAANRAAFPSPVGPGPAAAGAGPRGHVTSSGSRTYREGRWNRPKGKRKPRNNLSAVSLRHVCGTIT